MLLSWWCPTKFWCSTDCADEIQIENKTTTAAASSSTKPHTKTHCHHGDDTNGIQRSKLYLPMENERKKSSSSITLVSFVVLAAKACKSNVSTLAQLLVSYWTIERVQCFELWKSYKFRSKLNWQRKLLRLFFPV